MSYEIEPNETVAPETEVTAAEPPLKPLSGSAILTACVLLALPIGYLFLHHRSTSSVQAETTQAAVPNAASGTVNLPALETAVKADPSEANKITLSLGYIQAGLSGRAIPLLKQMTVTDPKDAMAWNNLCVAHTLQQAYADGIAACNQAVTLKPSFQLAKNNLLWVSGERDKTVRAITQLEQTAPGKRDATFYLTEGMDYLHLANYQEATQAWGRMLEVDPKSATAANNIGLAKMMEKQPEQAIPWFQKAIVLDPAMQLAKNNLAWAESVKGGK
jgi:tetratricopeptide (TPR) repeat protein